MYYKLDVILNNGPNYLQWEGIITLLILHIEINTIFTRINLTFVKKHD